MPLKIQDRNRIERRGVKPNHTSALWITTPGRRALTLAGLRPDDYNRRFIAGCEGRPCRNERLSETMKINHEDTKSAKIFPVLSSRSSYLRG
jgi:hypothetical protein